MRSAGKKAGIAAGLLASLLLCGCSGFGPQKKIYGTDYSKDYNDYLTYSLGSGYQLTNTETAMGSDGVCYTRWSAMYRDAGGGQREIRYLTVDYGDGGTAGLYESEQQFNDCGLADIMYSEVCRTGAREFARTILKNYFRDADADKSPSAEPERGVRVSLRFDRMIFPDLYPAVQAALDPETGLQVCTADLRSAAQDPNVIAGCVINIEKNEFEEDISDTDVYTEKMQHIYEDYLQRTGHPQNYLFAVYLIRISDTKGRLSDTCLFNRAALTGIGEFDASERYENNSAQYTAMQNELRELLKQQS